MTMTFKLMEMSAYQKPLRQMLHEPVVVLQDRDVFQWVAIDEEQISIIAR